jgi:hypothetical protein
MRSCTSPSMSWWCSVWFCWVSDIWVSDLPPESSLEPLPWSELADLAEPVGSTIRWQYAVASIGMFNTPDRMGEVLSEAGEHGWEPVVVYDKASNWLSGMENGFMLMRRMVPEGVTPSQWC